MIIRAFLVFSKLLNYSTDILDIQDQLLVIQGLDTSYVVSLYLWFNRSMLWLDRCHQYVKMYAIQITSLRHASATTIIP